MYRRYRINFIFFNASLILLIEMLPVSSSISANTTSPPVNIEEFAVDANEIGDVSNFFLLYYLR